MANKKEAIAEYKDHIEIIIKNSKRLQKLSEEILDAARIEGRSLDLNLERFDLIGLMTTMISDYSNQTDRNNLSIKFVCDGKDIDLSTQLEKQESVNLFVNTDKDRIIQVLSNILINSIKFTKKGSITTDVKRTYNRVFVKIRDSGPGIDKEILPGLFDKFITGSPSGTGLGLYICKNIIEAHGGNIWAKNNDGAREQHSHLLYQLIHNHWCNSITGD